MSDNEPSKAYVKYQIIRQVLDEDESLTRISKEKHISTRTLQRWIINYKKYGLAGLERKTRTDKNKSRFPQYLLECAQGLALKKPLQSIASIHRRIKELATNNNEQIPSYHCIYQVINNIPPGAITLAHEGEKAYEEEFDLLYRREARYPNEIWQADHTLLDIYLLNNGKSQRPWLTVIMDDFSRAIAGYYLSFDSPSALQTSLALRQAIWCKEESSWLICGIPEQLYTDHGSDFTSQHIETVCADLKIRLVFSAAGKPRGRGKIERFFKTINQKFLCTLPGYTRNETINPKLITIKEFEEKLKNFILYEYHKASHSFTKELPLARWRNDNFLPHLPESIEKLDLLLLYVAKPRKIHQDGIKFQSLRYIDAVLAAYVGEEVLIRYDPRDMAEIRVFYDGKFLCRAICQELTSESISLKDIQKARYRRKQELKNSIKQRKSLVDQLLFQKENITYLPNSDKQQEKQSCAKISVSKIKIYQNE